mmetsp:Transcript_25764/g.55072  ORF Transcript_25764/g.55072 Transcript_25764/m.55072 type:complete len:80 (-) Transcript_25764:181-420(-)
MVSYHSMSTAANANAASKYRVVVETVTDRESAVDSESDDDPDVVYMFPKAWKERMSATTTTTTRNKKVPPLSSSLLLPL